MSNSTEENSEDIAEKILPLLLTTPEAAAYLGVPTNFMRYQRDRFTYLQPGGKYGQLMFVRKSLEEFVEKNAIKPSENKKKDKKKNDIPCDSKGCGSGDLSSAAVLE
jgi:hypothetical protein